MNLKLLIAITVIETFSPLLPLIIYWKKRKFLEDYLIYVALLMLASFVADFMGMSTVFLRLHYMFRLIPSQVYHISSIVFICLLYKNLFPIRFKYFFYGAIIVLEIMFLYAALSSTTEVTNYLSRLPRNIVFLLITILFFFRMISQMPTIHIQRLPMFWINTAFLVFFAGTLLLSAFGNYLITELKDSMIGYASFQNILTMLCNVLIAIGLWQAKPAVKSL